MDKFEKGSCPLIFTLKNVKSKKFWIHGIIQSVGSYIECNNLCRDVYIFYYSNTYAIYAGYNIYNTLYIQKYVEYLKTMLIKFHVPLTKKCLYLELQSQKTVILDFQRHVLQFCISAQKKKKKKPSPYWAQSNFKIIFKMLKRKVIDYVLQHPFHSESNFNHAFGLV